MLRALHGLQQAGRIVTINTTAAIDAAITPYVTPRAVPVRMGTISSRILHARDTSSVLEITAAT